MRTYGKSGLMEGIIIAGNFYRLDSIEEMQIYSNAVDRLKKRMAESKITMVDVEEEVKHILIEYKRKEYCEK